MAFIYVGALKVDFRRGTSFGSPDYTRHNPRLPSFQFFPNRRHFCFSFKLSWSGPSARTLDTILRDESGVTSNWRAERVGPRGSYGVFWEISCAPTSRFRSMALATSFANSVRLNKMSNASKTVSGPRYIVSGRPAASTAGSASTIWRMVFRVRLRVLSPMNTRTRTCAGCTGSETGSPELQRLTCDSARFFSGYLRALFSCFGEADGDRLGSTFYTASLTTFSGL